MSQASRIRWNSLFSFLSIVIRLLTNFLLFVGIARFYGAESFGQFTTAHTLSSIFVLFADFGFDTLLAIEIARHRDRSAELARQYFSVKILFALGATIAMMLLPSFREFSSSTTTLIYIFSFYVLFSSLNNFFFALFKGFEQLQHETKISLGINVLLFLMLIILGLLHVHLYVVAVMFVATRIFGLFLAVRIADGIAKVNVFQFDFSGWKDIRKQVTIFGVHFIFGNLFFQLDTMLLAFWKGDHDVGMYQSVIKIVVLTLIVPDTAVYIFIPVLSRLHAESEERWNMIGRLLSKTLFLIGLPVAMIMFVYADQIIGILYGDTRFSEAIPLLRIFSATILIRFVVESYAMMLTTSQRQTTRMSIVVIATIVNCLLNIYAIPHYGILGAAYVSFTTNLLVGLCYIVATRPRFLVWSLRIHNIIPSAIILTLTIVLWQVREVPIWYTMPFVMAVYACVFYYVGYSKDERRLIFTQERNFSIHAA